MVLKLELIDNNTSYSSGYGAGSGQVITETYKCPCGKGKVYYEKDDIPGFKDTSIYSDCEECKSNYELGRGTATEK